jgi:DNA repair exonuclease SbcCD ATPase subunit
MSLSGDDHQKLVELCSLTYKEQLVWFLNAFWTTIGERDAEHFWDYQRKCSELDLQHRQAGSALDEMNAHVFLEHFKETMTVRAMRERLRESGAIGATERPKNVPITHILLFKYGVNWHELVNATQGDNKEEVAEAQRRLEAVQTAFREAEARAQEAAAALQEAKKSEADARAREAEAQAAKAELEAALAEVKAQEDAYNAKTQDLTQKSESGSIVARNKAKNELAQHLGEDPLPLRRAKITAEAAVKKADRTRAAAAAAREAAERFAAESEKAKAAAEEAVDEAQRQVGEAEQYLNEVKRKPGQAMGALWWIERELHEAKAYLPESKGGYRKPK